MWGDASGYVPITTRRRSQRVPVVHFSHVAFGGLLLVALLPCNGSPSLRGLLSGVHGRSLADCVRAGFGRSWRAWRI